MKKKMLIPCLAILAILGSLFTALGSNMFFDDIINIAAGAANNTLFVSFPGIAMASSFVVAVLYLIRIYKHPDCKASITKLYAIITMALGGLGLVGSILSGAVVYKNFLSSHPFPGYIIIFLILSLGLITLGVLAFLCGRKMPKDEGKIKINFLYVLKTIGWVLFIFLAFNRFGMLLGAPSYIYLRNLHQTWPFYVYLMMPMFLGVLEVLYILGILKGKKMFILSLVALGLNVAFFLYIFFAGAFDTAFISSLSQAMPLERVASKPLEILIHFLSYLGVGIALLVQNKKAKAE